MLNIFIYSTYLLLRQRDYRRARSRGSEFGDALLLTAPNPFETNGKITLLRLAQRKFSTGKPVGGAMYWGDSSTVPICEIGGWSDGLNQRDRSITRAKIESESYFIRPYESHQEYIRYNSAKSTVMRNCIYIYIYFPCLPMFYLGVVRPPSRAENPDCVSAISIRRNPIAGSLGSPRKAKSDIETWRSVRCILERRPELLSHSLRVAQIVNPRSRPCVSIRVPLVIT